MLIGRRERRPAPLRRIGLGILLAAAIALAVARVAYVEILVAQGTTMAPAILEGDGLLLRKGVAAKIGDVVLLEGRDGPVLRRLIGLPGDVIRARKGRLVRNDEAVKTEVLGEFTLRPPGTLSFPARQEYLQETPRPGATYQVLGDHIGVARPWRLRLEETAVGTGQVFLLCDNRPACSKRLQGLFPASWIAGVVDRHLWRGRVQFDIEAK